ncbi:MAG: potassium channel family protein [Gemmataceae bacterium]
MPNPVVLCGLGKIGSRVLDLLRAAGLPVVVVDQTCDPADPRLHGLTAVHGDCRLPAVLEQAGVRSARAVVVVTSDDLVNTSTALAVRRLNPTVRIVVRMFNPNLLARLGKAVGNVQALSVSALTAPLLAYTALTGEVLGSFHVGADRQQIAKLVVGPDSDLVGRRVSDVAAEYRTLPLAREGPGRPAELLLQVRGDVPLQGGDSLVVCGQPDDLARLLPLGDAAEWEHLLPGVRWAGRLRRFGRVAWRALGEVDLAVKICTAILVTVVIISTIFFYATGTTAPDALYRTISVIATGADMNARTDEHKVFVSFLRVFGAVLTAAFTAIVTNFLLRARLGGALEIRRVPESGHIVVCGLGNVGFRVVEELLKCHERVVVLERSRDNPFIGTCRRLGAAVIVGDASVPEVLRQARSATARAVVAATSDDLANLEIALLARELNPKQRVVVRLVDEALAETLREVVDVRLALSLPALAAPAFVAALFGDRVQSLFRINRRMLAAVELTVQPGDPCLKNQTLRALAVDYGLLPVGETDWHRRLNEGEKLTAVATLADLDRLFRRLPAAADWSVEVTGVPELAKPPVALLVRLENGVAAEDAAKALDALPLRVGGRKTRGQAEELRALLERERAAVNLVKA